MRSVFDLADYWVHMSDFSHVHLEYSKPSIPALSYLMIDVALAGSEGFYRVWETNGDFQTRFEEVMKYTFQGSLELIQRASK